MKKRIGIMILILSSIVAIILVSKLLKRPFKLKQVEIIREIELPQEPEEIEELELSQEEGMVEKEGKKPKEEIPEVNLEEIPFETLPTVRPEEEVKKSKEPTEERLQISPPPEELRKIKEKSLIIY